MMRKMANKVHVGLRIFLSLQKNYINACIRGCRSRRWAWFQRGGGFARDRAGANVQTFGCGPEPPPPEDSKQEGRNFLQLGIFHNPAQQLQRHSLPFMAPRGSGGPMVGQERLGMNKILFCLFGAQRRILMGRVGGFLFSPKKTRVFWGSNLPKRCFLVKGNSDSRR